MIELKQNFLLSVIIPIVFHFSFSQQRRFTITLYTLFSYDDNIFFVSSYGSHFFYYIHIKVCGFNIS